MIDKLRRVVAIGFEVIEDAELFHYIDTDTRFVF